MLKLAGVVLLYHPDKSKTIENIATYALQLNKLYIFDNSAQPSIALSKDLPHLNIPIEYISTGKNEGVAKRLNEASEKARQEGFDFLLTMDQDSSFKPGDFEKYKSLIHLSDNSYVAQYGVNHQPNFTPAKDLPEEALALITSGSILDLSLTDKVGLFNEDFLHLLVWKIFVKKLPPHQYSQYLVLLQRHTSRHYIFQQYNQLLNHLSPYNEIRMHRLPEHIL